MVMMILMILMRLIIMMITTVMMIHLGDDHLDWVQVLPGYTVSLQVRIRANCTERFRVDQDLAVQSGPTKELCIEPRKQFRVD